jgi:hypothetical protein
LRAKEIELAAATSSDDDRGERCLLAIREAGVLRAFAKVAADREALEREHAILTALRDAGPQSFEFPEVVALLYWRDYAVLVLRPFRTSGFADRPLGAHELAASAEIASLGPVFDRVLGAREGSVPLHGDFAPWNSARVSRELVLWDWENARLGHPLEDVFHWRVQRLVLFGRGTPEMVAGAAMEPDAQIRAMCEVLGLPNEAGRTGLNAYLRHSLGLLERREQGDRAVKTRRRILECLES